MFKVKIEGTIIDDLKERLSIANNRKSIIQQRFRDIYNKYIFHEITYEEYIFETEKKYDGRTLEEWIKTYDSYISLIKNKLEKEEKKKKIKRVFTIFGSIFLVIGLISTLFLFGLSLNLFEEEEKGVFVKTSPEDYQKLADEGLIPQEFADQKINEIKEKFNLPEENIEVEETSKGKLTTLQFNAILGSPVVWNKQIETKDGSAKVLIPKSSQNIKITKINPLTNEEIQINANSRIVTISESEGFFSSLFEGITGNAVLDKEEKEYLEIEINDNSNLYKIVYETPAPTSKEDEYSRGKNVEIISPEDIHYKNVLSFTELSEDLNITKPENVKIYWREQKKYIKADSIQDKNNDGVYDYIEWNAPSLSNQSFQVIIIITKAEHLDQNRTFISDIYQEVIEKDGKWSEPINSEEVVRVTFEIPLKSNNDITIFPRIVSGDPRIEIYSINNLASKIAEFNNLKDNEYNKIFLTNLTGEEHTFDLVVLGGLVEFDHIIDPIVNYNLTTNTTNKAFKSEQAGRNIWSGTEATGPEYYNITYEDALYARICATGGGTSNREPKWRFNFTINENPASITSLNISWKGWENASESGQPYVWNRTSAAVVDIGTVPTSNGWVTVNYTNTNIANFINPTNKQLVVYIEGSNFDGGECLFTDYVRVIVYTEAVPPEWQINSTNSTFAGSLILHSINWTDNVDLNGYIFSFDNGTGNFVNDTWVSMNGVSNWSNVTKAVNSTIGSIIRWIVYANDSSGNWNMTNTFQYTTTLENGVTSCGTLSTANTVYNLTVDILDNTITNDCIIISAQNITLDCKGYSITSTQNYTGVFSNQSNTTIKNCNVSMGSGSDVEAIGIELTNDANYSTVFNNTIIGQMSTGISFAQNNNGPEFSLIENNTVNINSSLLNRGIYLRNSNNTIIRGNNAINGNSGTGIYLYLSSNNTLISNTATSNSSRGIYFLSSSNNTLISNTATGNSSVILIWDSSNNTLISNTATSNSGDGISLWQADNNILTNNTATSNSSRGLIFDSSSDNNILTNNTATSNSSRGIYFLLSVNNTLTNQRAEGYLLGSSGIVFNGTNDTIIRDCVNISGFDSDILYVTKPSFNNTFINCSYRTSESYEIVTAESTLIRKWYYIANATNFSDNSPVIANITAVNSSGKIEFSVLTNSNGLTNLIEITDYVNNGGTRNYFSNYVINATNSSFSPNLVSHSFNSSLGNNYSDYFIFGVVNSLPVIDYVEPILAKTPIEGTVRNITFHFNVTDADGVLNLNSSSAKAYFQRAGETTRSNISCIEASTSGLSANYSCKVGMWYFDGAGAWTINVSISDNLGETAENSTTSFTYELLTSMVMFPNSLSWDTLTLSSINQDSNNDPILINNTGNAEYVSINVTAKDLRGESIFSDFIYANNFTVENVSPGCSGTPLVNATPVNITSAILQRGNNTINNRDATSGQEEIFFCLKGLPQGIALQSYSSSAYGSWEIIISLVGISYRKKKKKKNAEKDKLIETVGIIMDEIKEKYSLGSAEVMDILLKKMRIKYNLSKDALRELTESKRMSVPIDVFSSDLGSLESLVKYMKENFNMSYKEIAEELNRDQRTIWSSYNNAIKKETKETFYNEDNLQIPLSIFKNRKLTILESLVVYLKNEGMRYNEISKLLNRDQRNIWTTYSRAIKK